MNSNDTKLSTEADYSKSTIIESTSGIAGADLQQHPLIARTRPRNTPGLSSDRARSTQVSLPETYQLLESTLAIYLGRRNDQRSPLECHPYIRCDSRHRPSTYTIPTRIYTVIVSAATTSQSRIIQRGDQQAHFDAGKTAAHQINYHQIACEIPIPLLWRVRVQGFGYPSFDIARCSSCT